MHALLLRQLLRCRGSEDAPPEDWDRFVRAVNEAYAESDSDRQRLERTMELMSAELIDRHARLRAELEELSNVQAALRESESRLRREIEERKQVEVELRLKQKLEAVGQLAAGIAHEINTPIQFVGDSVAFLRGALQDYRTLLERYRTRLRTAGDLDVLEKVRVEFERHERDADLEYLDTQVPKALARVEEGTRRVISIVRAVKEFAHPDERECVFADLNAAIESTLTVTSNEYKYVADVVTEFGALPQVRCRIGDLNQVFLNLIVNAVHAIADAGKCGHPGRGRIVIRTSHQNGEVLVSVSDSGCGIPEGIRDRVFDPFFTTKEVGRGTGQGLAIARTIVVEKHGGALWFETECGVGTTFFVKLPVVGEGESTCAA